MNLEVFLEKFVDEDVNISTVNDVVAFRELEKIERNKRRVVRRGTDVQ